MKQLNFGKIKTKLPLPNLLDMQKQSFIDFLQLDVAPNKRELRGLQAAFEDVFPIEAPDGSMKLEFLKYDLGTPKYATPMEAAVQDGTYSAPLKAWFRLYIKQKNGTIKEVKESGNKDGGDITLCDLPLMTDAGCFVLTAPNVLLSASYTVLRVLFLKKTKKKHNLLWVKNFMSQELFLTEAHG